MEAKKAVSEEFDVPKNSGGRIGLSVEQYADLKVFMAQTDDKISALDGKIDKVDSKIDKLVDRIDDHMGSEEKAKKKILWIVAGIGVLYILNSMGVPIADLLSFMKLAAI